MLTNLETVASAIADKPHSFDHIRTATGLKLSDAQIMAMISKNHDRFKVVHFVKRDDEGAPVLPGRPGVRIRATTV